MVNTSRYHRSETVDRRCFACQNFRVEDGVALRTSLGLTGPLSGPLSPHLNIILDCRLACGLKQTIDYPTSCIPTIVDPAVEEDTEEKRDRVTSSTAKRKRGDLKRQCCCQNSKDEEEDGKDLKLAEELPREPAMLCRENRQEEPPIIKYSSKRKMAQEADRCDPQGDWRDTAAQLAGTTVDKRPHKSLKIVKHEVAVEALEVSNQTLSEMTARLQEQMDYLRCGVTGASYQDLKAVRTCANDLLELLEGAMQTSQDQEHKDIVRQKEALASELSQQRQTLLAEFSEKERVAQSERTNLKAEMAALEAEKLALRKKLEMEQEKCVCQICLVNPRDTLIVPCMHFHFCNLCLLKHREQKNTCPTCRTTIRGIVDLFSD